MRIQMAPIFLNNNNVLFQAKAHIYIYIYIYIYNTSKKKNKYTYMLHVKGTCSENKNIDINIHTC